MDYTHFLGYRPVDAGVVGPGGFKAEPALQLAAFVCRHLTEELRDGVGIVRLVLVVVPQFRKSHDDVNRKLPRRRHVLFVDRYVEVVWSYATLLRRDPELAGQRLEGR
jgi:hypothetical protein